MKKINLLSFCLTILIGSLAYAQEEFNFNIDDIEIKHEKFVLDNGLTVIIHEDHKAPIVAVNVWYHVGSKNEKFGKTGFAHLFEHLMFNGSENFNTDYFEAMERIGATDLNGTTNFDRTNYFQNVPKSAFDIALWMESDRMGHFAGAISQERLDEQRGVVQNEKRQGENQPYGRFFNQLTLRCFPKNHPYAHTVIGSMEDLNSASLDDVKEWFATYYGASNATLVIAGDVETEDALAKVKKYFGDIPSGPPVTHPKAYIAKRTGEIREVMQDRVPQTRIYMIWNVPEWGNKEAFDLDVVSAVLSSGKTSRLYKRLVYDEQIVTTVNTYNWENELAGIFGITADVKANVDPAVVEKAINEELEKLLKEGITSEELSRVKTEYFADFIRGIERIGGFGGKSDILAQNQVFMGDPNYYKVRLQGMRDVTAEHAQKAAVKWLSDGKYVLQVVPFPEFSTSASEVDRSTGLPELAEAAKVKFPDIQESQLSNGMKIMLAQRSSVPMVQLSMQMDIGYAADQFAKPGTAQLAFNMLDEGTSTMDALQISEGLDKLGASITSGSNLDMSSVNLSALKANFEASMDIYADVILNPAFPQNEFERLKKQQLDGIRQQKANPIQMALRVMPKFMYGEGHAYSLPFTGSGFENTVSEISREDLQIFYNEWFSPSNATIVAVGDITMDELTDALEKRFKKWKAFDVPKKNLSTVSAPDNKVYIIDRPGSIQSVIIAGHVTEPYGKANEKAVYMANNIIGGEFTSRVNMNLREAKGWSYGARTILIDAKGQRPYVAYAPVQSDKTSESIAEIKKELTDYLGDKPATEEEFKKTKENEVLSLPGQWETMASVRGSMAEMVRYNLPKDYYQTYADGVRNLKLADIHEASNQIIHPEQISWIVVGDREKIEGKIKELGFGEVVIIDADGNILEPGTQKLELEK